MKKFTIDTRDLQVITLIETPVINYWNGAQKHLDNWFPDNKVLLTEPVDCGSVMKWSFEESQDWVPLSALDDAQKDTVQYLLTEHLNGIMKSLDAETSLEIEDEGFAIDLLELALNVPAPVEQYVFWSAQIQKMALVGWGCCHANEALNTETLRGFVKKHNVERPPELPGFNKENRDKISAAWEQAAEICQDFEDLNVQNEIAFYILVDMSGSMSGDPAEAASKGVLLLAEVLGRMKISYKISAFQRNVMPVVDWSNEITAKSRKATLGMYKMAGGGNDDARCVEQAAQELHASGVPVKYLIVVSDGSPPDEQGLTDTLERISSEPMNINVMGVGIGEGTEHVEKLYKEAIANVSLEHFQRAIGRILYDKISQLRN